MSGRRIDHGWNGLPFGRLLREARRAPEEAARTARKVARRVLDEVPAAAAARRVLGKVPVAAAARRVLGADPAAAARAIARKVHAAKAPAGSAAAPEAAPIPGRAARVRDPKDLWVAAILDEMSAACFAPECHLVQPRPDDWREILEARRPHLLLVESAWKGNDGAWQYKVGRYDHPDAGGLKELVEWCRARGIPTVFWNKEDPVHFEKFKQAAALFDHVFTTDSGSVDRYLALPRSHIRTCEALPFAAQPRLHNPVSVGPRSPAPCFAGSYYGNRHHQRRAQQEALLDAARPFGLVLYDRNAGSESPDFRFPERFLPHIRGRLPYERLSREYKAHQVFLNVNSVVDSPTMLSRRVYELLASGTVVVSTPSRALAETFGDLVPVASTAEEAEQLLRRLSEDDGYREALARRGVRFVLSRHTYRHRLAQVARACGLLEGELAAPAVSAVAEVHSDAELGRVLAALAAQTRPASEVLLAAGPGLSEEVVASRAEQALPGARVRVLAAEDAGAAPSASTLEDADPIRLLGRLAAGEWVLLLHAGTLDAGAPDPGAPLPDTGLEDLAACTLFADADVVATGAGDNAHRYAAETDAPGPMLVRREVLAARGRPEGRLASWTREGVRLYLAPLTPAAAAQARRAAG